MNSKIWLLMFFTPWIAGAALPVSSRIAEATVYPDRARVTRTAEVQVPAGESILQFVGLPVNLDDSSVQASGEGSGEVKILGLEVRRKFLEQTANDAVRKLQEEIQGLDDQNQKLDDEARDIAERRAFLQQLREGMSRDLGKDSKATPLTAAQIKSVYDLYGSEIKELTERTRAIGLEKRVIAPKRSKLQNEIARLSGGGPATQKEVLVSVRSSAAAAATVRISYVMPGASWTPVYDARARVEQSVIELGCFALVRQNTGENWKDVKLSLSTARPSVGARMAELDPWWINTGAPQSSMLGMLKSSRMAFERDQLQRNDLNAPMSASGDEGLREEDKKPFEAVMAAIDSGGVSAVFHVKVPADIPSDGEPHKTMIAGHRFKGKLDYVTTPKLMESAFLKARLINTSEFPILGGEVNLFLEDDFIGKSRVNYIAQSAEFDFYLGVDDGIKVTRKQMANRTETSGIIRKDTVQTRKYEILVENYKKTAQTVTVFDQIPVSQNEQVRVTGVQYSETPKKVEKDTGKVAWEFPLKPGEKKKITLEFSVERPQGMALAGL